MGKRESCGCEKPQERAMTRVMSRGRFNAVPAKIITENKRILALLFAAAPAALLRAGKNSRISQSGGETTAVKRPIGGVYQHRVMNIAVTYEITNISGRIIEIFWKIAYGYIGKYDYIVLESYKA
jgi:hypothetical protein